MRLILALVAFAVVIPAGVAAAQSDQLIVRDTRAHDVYALGDTLVYNRVGKHNQPLRGRAWMRVVGGRKLRARGVPKGAFASAIGRDRRGRVVLTMSVSHYGRHRLLAREWWVYDVKSDRARRLSGLQSGSCFADYASIWRGRLAYSRECVRLSDAGVFLREHGRTRRVAHSRFATDWEGPLALRAGTLLAVRGDLGGDTAVWRVMDGGKVCRREIPSSFLDEEFGQNGIWISGHTALWWVVDRIAYAQQGLVGAQLDGKCGPFGPTGAVEPPVIPSRMAAPRAIDRHSLYFAEKDGIHRADVPRKLQTEPPANDMFAAAAPLVGPSSWDLKIGDATKEAGEPTTYATRTVWYALRSPTARKLNIDVGILALDVFTGSSLGSLKSVVFEPDGSGGLAFDVVPGTTYYIRIGCNNYRCYLPEPIALKPAS